VFIVRGAKGENIPLFWLSAVKIFRYHNPVSSLKLSSDLTGNTLHLYYNGQRLMQGIRQDDYARPSDQAIQSGYISHLESENYISVQCRLSGKFVFLAFNLSSDDFYCDSSLA
jgi:hypothetical protein